MSATGQVPDRFRLNDGKLMLAIADIIVGERHRKDMGDIDKLAESIDDVGQLQPVVVTRNRELIGGSRRIEALRKLGMDDAEVTIATNVDDAVSKLKAERDENTCRQQFTRAEANALGKDIKALLATEAEERQKAGKAAKPSHDSSEGSTKGRTDEKVAEVTGIKPTMQREMDYVEKIAVDIPELPDDVKEFALKNYQEIQAGQPVHPRYLAVKEAVEAASTPEAPAKKPPAKKAAPKEPAKDATVTQLHPDQDSEVHAQPHQDIEVHGWITLGTMFTPILTGFDTLMDNDEQPSDIDGTIARLQFVSDAINDVITWLKEI